jgi:hypothetical protein
MLKHVNMKPPAIMPEAMVKSLADKQTPIVPPTAMLASNQEIQTACVRGTV